MNDSRLQLAHILRKSLATFPDTDCLSMIDASDLLAGVSMIDDADCDLILASIKDGSQQLVLGWDFKNTLQFVMQPTAAMEF